jgi:hypothetical protein
MQGARNFSQMRQFSGRQRSALGCGDFHLHLLAQATQFVAEALDVDQRRPQVVRDNIQHCLQLLVFFRQLLRQLRQVFLVVFAGGDIDARSDVTGEFSVTAAQGNAMVQDPAPFAIVTAEAIFHEQWLARLERGSMRVQTTSPIVWVNALLPTISQFLLQKASGELELHCRLNHMRSLSGPLIQINTAPDRPSPEALFARAQSRRSGSAR